MMQLHKCGGTQRWCTDAHSPHRTTLDEHIQVGETLIFLSNRSRITMGKNKRREINKSLCMNVGHEILHYL